MGVWWRRGGGGSREAGGRAASPSPSAGGSREDSGGHTLSTWDVFWDLRALYFTHITVGIMVTMPFTVAVFMVRDFLEQQAAAAGTEPPGGDGSSSSAVDERAVGMATGALTAAFSAAQLLTSYPLGWFSDRAGRKPIILLGNASSAASVLLFGLSSSYSSALAARVLGGVFNGIIGAEKAIMGEGLPDKQAQAKGFGLFSLMWGLGSLLGPTIGGALSQPCAGGLRVEALCGPGTLLASRPYFLPCMLTSVLCMLATLWCAVGLEETLPRRRQQHKSASEQSLLLKGGRWGWPFRTLGGSAGSSREAVQGEEEAVQEQRRLLPATEDSSLELSLSVQSRGSRPSMLSMQEPVEGQLGGSGATAGSDKGALAQRRDSSSSSLDLVVYSQADVAQQAQHAQQAQQQEQGDGQEWGQGDGEVAPLWGAGSHPDQKAGPSHPGAPPPPFWQQRAVIVALLGYMLIAWLYCQLDELVPIFASAPVKEGGLGYSATQLAPSLSWGAIVLMAYALWGFPWVSGRVGNLRALRYGLWQTVPMALLIPAASFFGGRMLPSQAVMFAAEALKAVAGTNTFTGCLILVNAAAPADQLGAVNGVGQSLASFVRALGPALGGLSWAWSLQLQRSAWFPSWGHQFLPFVFAALLAMAADVLYMQLHLPPEDLPRKSSGGSRGGGSVSCSRHDINSGRISSSSQGGGSSNRQLASMGPQPPLAGDSAA